MKLGEIIAQIREEQNLSQKDLAEKLSHEGVQISNQAISKWEKGNTLPNALQFLALCKTLQITDIYGTFIGAGNTSPFDGLNADGKQKALDYIELLHRSNLYHPEPTSPKLTVLRTLPLYQISVSAGTGQFLDSDDYELIEVGEDVPMNANFGVRICGDSMEPRFQDGQIVWVHQQQTIENGEIGIFLYNGDAYCKKFAANRDGAALVSLNTAYAPIQLLQSDELRVFGKVVG